MSILRKVYGWERYLLIACLVAIGVAAVLTEPINARARQTSEPKLDEHNHHHGHGLEYHFHESVPQPEQPAHPTDQPDLPALNFHHL